MRSYDQIRPTIFIYYDDYHMIQIPIKKVKEGLEEEECLGRKNKSREMLSI